MTTNALAAIELLLRDDDLDAIVVALRKLDLTDRRVWQTVIVCSPIVYVQRGGAFTLCKRRRGNTFVIQDEDGFIIARKQPSWVYNDELGVIRRGQVVPRAIALAFDKMPEASK